MKTFDVYLNELMQDRLYIKLNEKWSLFIGEINIMGFFDEEDDIDFIPASNDQESHIRIHIQPNEKMALKRYEEYDGREIDIHPKYHKAIIKRTFDDE